MRLWLLAAVYGVLASPQPGSLQAGRSPDAPSWQGCDRRRLTRRRSSHRCRRRAWANRARTADRRMVRQTEIRIAPETRAGSPRSRWSPGSMSEGRPVARLDNPELAASSGEASPRRECSGRARPRLLRRASRRGRDRRRRPSRPPRPIWCWREQQHDRAAALTGKNFASRQKLDESTASLAKAQADLDLKRAQAGGSQRRTDCRGARPGRCAGGARRGDGGGLQAQLDKTGSPRRPTAPSASVVAEPGEIIARQAGDDPRGRRPTVARFHGARGRSQRLDAGRHGRLSRHRTAAASRRE